MLALVLIAWANRLVAQNPGSTSPVCLNLTLGPWDTKGGGWVGEKFHAVPPLVVLDTSKVAGGFGVGSFALRPTVGSGRAVAFWRRMLLGTLSLTWTDGFTGVGITLEVQGDSLVGLAEARSDGRDPNMTYLPRASVVALRVACPASIKGK